MNWLDTSHLTLSCISFIGQVVSGDRLIGQLVVGSRLIGQLSCAVFDWFIHRTQTFGEQLTPVIERLPTECEQLPTECEQLPSATSDVREARDTGRVPSSRAAKRSLTHAP